MQNVMIVLIDCVNGSVGGSKKCHIWMVRMVPEQKRTIVPFRLREWVCRGGPKNVIYGWFLNKSGRHMCMSATPTHSSTGVARWAPPRRWAAACSAAARSGGPPRNTGTAALGDQAVLRAPGLAARALGISSNIGNFSKCGSFRMLTCFIIQAIG